MQIEIRSPSSQVVRLPDLARQMTSLEKLKLVGRRAGLFLGLCLLSVFLPVVHFVLVPLFFGLAFYFGWKASRARYLIPKAQTSCPHCQAPLTIEAQELEDEKRFFCSACRDQLKLQVAATTATS